MNFNDNNATDDSDDSFDSIFERFERQFANDDAHRIENEFEHQRNLRHEILAKLICLEIDLRNKANHPLDRFEYIERFPGFEREIKDAFRNVREIDVVFSTISQTHIDTDKGMLSLDGGTVDIPESLGHYEIQEKLGAGSFGVVFRAVDTNSGQTVALKFPRRRVLESREELKRFLEEAAAARGLDHPGIVRTHGVEQIEGFVFIVQQFVDGTDLTSLEESETSFKQVVEILARISDAVAYAHQNGYVHRDLKPANILLDRSGNPYIADFGLAIHESAQRMLKGQRCGSVAYMSPELAQGLSHRLDSRSDIWSLGVIMYQLLSGRRPFGGDTRDEIFDEIKTLDVRPLRMLDPEIDIELQRICLRCLNKRILERYPTADELAEDLRCWLSQPVHPRVPAPIVPKGLRSYGAEDAEFFLQLLPGPTDRNGFPESIRFWKTRIESTDSQVGFPLGVIFGPSGCGKSSFIKAGLLPNLDRRTVKPIYIESTSVDTEVRLIKSLRAEFSEIPERISLPRLFHSIKEQLWSPRDKKVLIVLDQFEQWLYAADKQQEFQLMEALRYCDGYTLQCIVTVRDDFWVKISTFMNELDINLNEGENVRRLDRFTMKHARKILAEFGRAYDCLPNDLTELTSEQSEFLDEAIGQLAEDDRVISVRLALTAEMFKNRDWTRAELKRVGGVSGIGERFLQETFESKDASPEYSVHNRAAQAVLESLLPPTGSDIRGHMRSHTELLSASTYESQPEKFDTLIHILNHDLRLTTPTDPDIVSAEAEVPASKGQFFQLTHDYLVPSIRAWLTCKKKETWRGRAELRLTERSNFWEANPENRSLPEWWECLNIRLFTRANKWTVPQSRMMRKASTLHGMRGIVVLLVFVILSWIGWASFGTFRARSVVDELLSANIVDVPNIISKISPYRRWTDPRLKAVREKIVSPHGSAPPNEVAEHSRQLLRISLALLPSNSEELTYLHERLLEAEPNEVAIIREILAPNKDRLTEKLWREMEFELDDKGPELLRAASALALFEPNETLRWQAVRTSIVDRLVRVPTTHLPYWMDLLRPVSGTLIKPLFDVHRDEKRSVTERRLATDLLADYAADDPQMLVAAIQLANEEQFSVLLPVLGSHGEVAKRMLEASLQKEIGISFRYPQTKKRNQPGSIQVWRRAAAFAFWVHRYGLFHLEVLKEDLAKRKANAAAALIKLEREQAAWSVLKSSPDQRARSMLIHKVASLDVNPVQIVTRLEEEEDITIQRALILSLSGFELNRIPNNIREKLISRLLSIFSEHDDPGIHGATQWLLNKWGKKAETTTSLASLVETESQLGERHPDDVRNWFVNTAQHTMVVIHGDKFLMGSFTTDPERENDERLVWANVNRKFAIAATETTRAQYRRFQDEGGVHVANMVEHQDLRFMARTPDSPITGMTWHEAAAYCNWLSKVEGIPKSQWCYDVSNHQAEDDLLMLSKPDYLSLIGYRLPTRAEWEFSCRAGTTTVRHYGQTDVLLPMYARYAANCKGRMWPVASLKPNDFGLFDMHGSVWEWCQDELPEYLTKEASAESRADLPRGLRGGSFHNQSYHVRTAD